MKSEKECVAILEYKLGKMSEIIKVIESVAIVYISKYNSGYVNIGDLISSRNMINKAYKKLSNFIENEKNTNI